MDIAVLRMKLTEVNAANAAGISVYLSKACLASRIYQHVTTKADKAPSRDEHVHRHLAATRKTASITDRRWTLVLNVPKL